MPFRFTRKAADDGVGELWTPAIPADDGQERYWLAHGYIERVGLIQKSETDARNAGMKSPAAHGAIMESS